MAEKLVCGFFQRFFVIQFVKRSRKGDLWFKSDNSNLSWKLCFVKPEEREYVSQEILIIMKNYCWLFLWITLGMSRFRRASKHIFHMETFNIKLLLFFIKKFKISQKPKRDKDKQFQTQVCNMATGYIRSKATSFAHSQNRKNYNHSNKCSYEKKCNTCKIFGKKGSSTIINRQKLTFEIPSSSILF